MKAKLIESVYHYKNHQIIIEPFCGNLCGWAVEFKYAHLFKCITELGIETNEELGLDPDVEISYFSIDRFDESIIYHNKIDINKEKSILKFLMGCIDDFGFNN
jgi:hypothetical protein